MVATEHVNEQTLACLHNPMKACFLSVCLIGVYTSAGVCVAQCDCVCACVYVSVCLPVSRYECVFLYVSVYISVYNCMLVHMFVVSV